MASYRNGSITKRWIEDGFNGRDMAAFDRYFSANLVDQALPPGVPAGLEGRKMLAGAFFAAFPDIHLHAEDIIEEGERVAMRWMAHGTHQGEFMGIPATGKQVRITGIAIDRFENGQVVEHWEQFDQLSMMQQLGVIPGQS
ncbi:MAG: ester cyclase [Caldilineaceae bacterium]|nr:ester cyclase [Caldilineaceae bacterium]